MTTQRIKEDADYEGVRVNFAGHLEKARITMQMDIGFGDAITPAAAEATFPVMLDQPAPVLLTYPRETAIAEKFEAMVKLGIANSRMKDFYDLRSLAALFAFDGKILSEAVRRTFGGGGLLFLPSPHRQQYSLPNSLRTKPKQDSGMRL